MRAALAREVDFPGFDDPETRLQQALLFVSVHYGLNIAVDHRAFVQFDLMEVGRVSPRSRISVHRLLREFLSRDLYAGYMPVIEPFTGRIVSDPVSGKPIDPLATDDEAPDGDVFVVWPEGIEVTTAASLRAKPGSRAVAGTHAGPDRTGTEHSGDTRLGGGIPWNRRPEDDPQ